ncbi:MAG TPA: hypothetical protein VGZ47_13745 [Gemmataceae bacterium]|nr:hypothetical protein [Gemmataceae bacterium]
MQKNIDWKTMGDTVCAILTAIYVDEAEQYRKEALKRGITVEQLAAAAITGMVQEAVEGARNFQQR